MVDITPQLPTQLQLQCTQLLLLLITPLLLSTTNQLEKPRLKGKRVVSRPLRVHTELLDLLLPMPRRLQLITPLLLLLYITLLLPSTINLAKQKD